MSWAPSLHKHSCRSSSSSSVRDLVYPWPKNTHESFIMSALRIKLQSAQCKWSEEAMQQVCEVHTHSCTHRDSQNCVVYCQIIMRYTIKITMMCSSCETHTVEQNTELMHSRNQSSLGYTSLKCLKDVLMQWSHVQFGFGFNYSTDPYHELNLIYDLWYITIIYHFISLC